MTNAGKHSTNNSNRRTFLSNSWFWVKSAALATIVYPLFKFTGFAIPKRPQLVKVHKTLKPGGFIMGHDFIIFDGSEAPWAVSRRCTHLGCRLNFNEKEKLLICPCHQSKFTMTGIRVDGPARRNLTLYAVAQLPQTEGKGFVVTI